MQEFKKRVQKEKLRNEVSFTESSQSGCTYLCSDKTYLCYIYVLLRLGFSDKKVLFMFVFAVNPSLLTSNVFAPFCVILSSKPKNHI